MPSAPDSDPSGTVPRHGERLAVSALVVAAFALNLNANVLGALLPFLGAEFDLRDGNKELLIAAGALGTAVGALAVGPVSRRIGRRGTLQLGMAVFVLASLLTMIPGNFWLFATLRGVSGLAAGLAYAAASALAARVTPYARRGAAMGWFSAGMFLAIPVGMPLSVLFARSGFWPAIFGLQALVGLFALFGTARAVPDLRDDERGARWRDVLGNSQVRAGLLATMLHVGSFFTTVQLATVWLDDTGRVPKADQIYLWIALGMLSVVGSAGLGRLSDRVGKRIFVLTCSAVLVGCYLLLAGEPGSVAMLAIALVLAVAAAARTGPLQALISGLVPEGQLSALMGLRSAAMQGGAGVFALIAAPLAAEFGFRGVLLLAAACQVGSYSAIRFGVRKG